MIGYLVYICILVYPYFEKGMEIIALLVNYIAKYSNDILFPKSTNLTEGYGCPLIRPSVNYRVTCLSAALLYVTSVLEFLNFI